jgi:hypothetical protein
VAAAGVCHKQGISERMVFVNQGNRAPGALLLAYEDDTWMLAVA